MPYMMSITPEGPDACSICLGINGLAMYVLTGTRTLWGTVVLWYFGYLGFRDIWV